MSSTFKAFRFPSTGIVNFEVQVRFCQDKCENVKCATGGDSYGRRRRRRSMSSKDKADENYVTTSTSTISPSTTSLATAVESSSTEAISSQSTTITPLEEVVKLNRSAVHESPSRTSPLPTPSEYFSHGPNNSTQAVLNDQIQPDPYGTASRQASPYSYPPNYHSSYGQQSSPQANAYPSQSNYNPQHTNNGHYYGSPPPSPGGYGNGGYGSGGYGSNSYPSHNPSPPAQSWNNRPTGYDAGGHSMRINFTHPGGSYWNNMNPNQNSMNPAYGTPPPPMAAYPREVPGRAPPTVLSGHGSNPFGGPPGSNPQIVNSLGSQSPPGGPNVGSSSVMTVQSSRPLPSKEKGKFKPPRPLPRPKGTTPTLRTSECSCHENHVL